MVFEKKLLLRELLDINLKTPLTSVDAAAEVGHWLNKNNKKCPWNLT